MIKPNIIWTVSEKIGSVSGIQQIDENSKCILILGHGAGAGMAHPFMTSLADNLSNLNIGVVRYNFPYMEQGKRRPDFPAVAHATIRTVVSDINEKFDLPLVLSGKSFGGRMASQWVAKKEVSQIKGMVFYGFPLHGIGKEGIERAEHLGNIDIPMYFLQGTRDKLAKMDLINQVIDEHKSATISFIEEGDHSFKVPKRTGFNHEQIITQLAEKTNHWIEQNILK